MNERDIFDDFEKSIEKAFKVEEKKIGKKSFYDSHSHFHSNPWLSQQGAYNEMMRNYHNHELEYEMLKNLREESHHRQNITVKNICCEKCHSILQLFVEEPHRHTYYEYTEYSTVDLGNIQVSNIHCPICGNLYRCTGKIIKVLAEVVI